VRPARPQAGAWRTKRSSLTTNYEPKSPSRRAGDQSDEKSSLFEVPSRTSTDMPADKSLTQKALAVYHRL
jgi:hypothetical protein